MSWPTATRARLEVLRICPRDAVRAVLVELRRVDPADVVGLEDGRIEHGGMLVAPVVVSTLQHVERKLASVLFVDIVDSTRLVTGADPEVVRRRVNEFFETVSHVRDAARRHRREVRRRRRHGGVRRSAGARGRRAAGRRERRSRCAQAVDELELEARIGIEAGEVVVDGSESTFATGEAVNLAARLQEAARPGRDPRRPDRVPARRRQASSSRMPARSS